MADMHTYPSDAGDEYSRTEYPSQFRVLCELTVDVEDTHAQWTVITAEGPPWDELRVTVGEADSGELLTVAAASFLQDVARGVSEMFEPF